MALSQHHENNCPEVSTHGSVKSTIVKWPNQETVSRLPIFLLGPDVVQLVAHALAQEAFEKAEPQLQASALMSVESI